jgi:UDP-glucose 4-epimerase
MSFNLSSFNRKRALVTGGLGFIGSSLACRLVELGARVVVVDAMLPNCGGNRANIAGYENCIVVEERDLCQRTGVDALVEGQDFIFNFAGRVSHLDSMMDPVADMEANLHAHINLLEACRARAPEAAIVFASTRQIYGKPVALPVAESHPLRPVDVNGVHKMAAETLHTLYHDVYGLRAISLRLTNTYGPRMRIKDARQTFLGVWLRMIVERRPFEVWGGEQLRDFSYIDDALEACLRAGLATEGWGLAFNVGGSPPISLIELARVLARLDPSTRYQLRDFPTERKLIDIGDYYADDRAFRTKTGWVPRVSLEEGLARSLAYYRGVLNAYV